MGDVFRSNTMRRELTRQAKSIVDIARQLEQSEDYPSATAPSFCRLIRLTAEHLKAKLPIAPPEKLGHVQEMLFELGKDLRYPERSRIGEIPWSMAQSTESFLRSQLGPDYSFIIRPQWAYNYSIRGEFSQSYRTRIKSLGDWINAEEWGTKLKELANKRFFTISFPRVERLNVLMHVNWGHEVGHILASQWLRSKLDVIWKVEEPAVRERIRKELARSSSDPAGDMIRALTLSQTVAEYTRRTLDLVVNGLAELISDAVGAHLFGPSTLSSLADFSVRFGLDANPLKCGDYPPWRFRIRYLANVLTEDISYLGYPDELKPFIEAIQRGIDLTKERKDEASINSDVRSREAYGFIAKNWKSIQTEVLEMLPATSRLPYRLKERSEIVRELVQRVRRGIPPNETGLWPNCLAAKIEDIWSAGWAAAHLCLKDEKWGEPEDYSRLYKLILKGIESSFVQQEYGSLLDK